MRIGVVAARPPWKAQYSTSNMVIWFQSAQMPPKCDWYTPTCWLMTLRCDWFSPTRRSHCFDFLCVWMRLVHTDAAVTISFEHEAGVMSAIRPHKKNRCHPNAQSFGDDFC